MLYSLLRTSDEFTTYPNLSLKYRITKEGPRRKVNPTPSLVPAVNAAKLSITWVQILPWTLNIYQVSCMTFNTWVGGYGGGGNTFDPSVNLFWTKLPCNPPVPTVVKTHFPILSFTSHPSQYFRQWFPTALFLHYLSSFIFWRVNNGRFRSQTGREVSIPNEVISDIDSPGQW